MQSHSLHQLQGVAISTEQNMLAIVEQLSLMFDPARTSTGHTGSFIDSDFRTQTTEFNPRSTTRPACAYDGNRR